MTITNEQIETPKPKRKSPDYGSRTPCPNCGKMITQSYQRYHRMFCEHGAHRSQG